MHPSIRGHVRLSAHWTVTAALLNQGNKPWTLDFYLECLGMLLFPCLSLQEVFLQNSHDVPLQVSPAQCHGSISLVIIAGRRDGGREPGMLWEPGWGG